jgi:hypothetical protein
MMFQHFSYDFPTCFLCFFQYFYDFPTYFLWFSHMFSMIIPHFSYDFPTYFLRPSGMMLQGWSLHRTLVRSSRRRICPVMQIGKRSPLTKASACGSAVAQNGWFDHPK